MLLTLIQIAMRRLGMKKQTKFVDLHIHSSLIFTFAFGAIDVTLYLSAVDYMPSV